MRKYGLIGYPLGHSFSKRYFTEKFLNENISGCIYDNYPLVNLSLFQKLISDEPELCGLNVTIPYKSEIISFLDYIDPEAREIGAVNVLKIKRLNGAIKLFGFNSDVNGIRDSLSLYLNSTIRKAIVLGTGGSSRAVCHVLKKLDLKITQISRTKKSGLLTYSDIDSELLRDTNLIINTTPLGMFPDTESKPDIAYGLLGKDHILFDLVYNPEYTAFLRMGAKQGCTVISGIKMLHSQAERAWEIWNDKNL